MKISIQHTTTYRYDQPVFFGVQRLHLRAMTNAIQDVESWELSYDGATEQLSYLDAFGNATDLIKLLPSTQEVTIRVDGSVSTVENAGIYGYDPSPLPDWFYQTTWRYTAPGPESRRIARRFAPAVKREGATVEMLHELSAAITEAVAYEVGGTQVDTVAEEALERGRGVCQDHAHIMISVCRQLGMPARYVSGYLLMDGVVDQTASHAWCEVFVERIGWVGFDVSNGISPDERYVRVGIGRDYADVPPVYGIRYGPAVEELDVQLQVQQ